MNSLEELKTKIEEIEERLGYVFENKEILINSLIHRSYVNEHKEGSLAHNERLEFLGDSVLGLVVGDYLYHRLPSYPEGTLSQLRSKLVEAATCAKYLRKLNIQEFILLGRGELITEGRNKVSILADAFEAVVGAIYLDAGLLVTKSFLLCHFEEEANEAIGSPPRNFKAELQDYSQRKFQQVPVYKIGGETGPAHAKLFHVIVYVDEKEAGMGMGASKKEAEQRAAFDALAKLGDLR